jgi:hypothetical protein
MGSGKNKLRLTVGSLPGPSIFTWPSHMGRQSEAQDALAQARKLNPKLTVKWYRTRIDVPEAYYEGLRKAGLPENKSRKWTIRF